MSRIVWASIVAWLAVTVCSAVADEQLPVGWTGVSPRDEIRPRFGFDPTGGPDRTGVLTIRCGDSVADQGYLKRTEAIKGGTYIRFHVLRRTSQVAIPRRSAPVRIVWTDEAGKAVRADPPPGRESEPGPVPLAEPEHPLDSAPDKDGWVKVEGTYRVPSKATRAVTELHLQWAPQGRADWAAVRWESVPAPPRRPVRLAAIHYYPTGKSPEENCREYEPLIAQAAAGRADLVVLGETVPYVRTGKKPHEIAEPIPGPTTRYFGELASRHRLHVVVSLYERSGKAVYNSAVLIGPDGKVIGTYRKVCLPHAEIEWGVTAGDSFPVFSTKLGKIGMMICYDGFFPEPARELAINGAEIIAWPVWGCNPLLGRARACENHVYLVSSTYTDASADWTVSAVHDHAGKLVGQAKKWGDVVTVDVDLSERHFWRNNLGDFKSMNFRHRPAGMGDLHGGSVRPDAIKKP